MIFQINVNVFQDNFSGKVREILGPSGEVDGRSSSVAGSFSLVRCCDVDNQMVWDGQLDEGVGDILDQDS